MILLPFKFEHNKQYELFVVHIQRCDLLNGQLYVVDHSREAHQIDLQNI